VVNAITRMDPTPPACKAGDPHSVQTGSINGDLNACMPHNHPLDKVDNCMPFDTIKTSIRGHNVATMIAPFCRAQDGRGALLALQSQYAGKKIYYQLVKDAKNVLKNRTWLEQPLSL
jgi:hypothetical protein